MTERKILITITDETWDDEDHDWLTSQLRWILLELMNPQDYTIQEFDK